MTPTPQAHPDEAYPPAPWRSIGQCWSGVFWADAPATLPPGLTPVLSRSLRVIALVRYLEGTLRYDEVMIATPARRGRYRGVYVQHLWVNNAVSRWGGRRIWGLPKELATFTWDDAGVTVADTDGIILRVHVNQRWSQAPPVFMTGAGIGRIGDCWTLARTPMWGRLGAAHMRIMTWSTRFGYHVGSRPLVQFAAKPFYMTVPPPIHIPY